MKKVVLIVTVEDSALTFYRNYVRFLVGRGWEVSVVGHSSGALEAWAAREALLAITSRRAGPIGG